MSELDFFINNNRLFSQIGRAEVESLCARRHPFKYRRDEVIFMHGDPSDTMYFLGRGLVRLSKLSYDGRKFTLDIVEPGGFFGELCLAGEAQRRSIAEAAEDVSGFEIKKAVFEGYLVKRPEIAIKLIKIISDKRIEMENILEDMIFMDVENRVVSLLLKYTEGGTVKLTLTHQEIADMTGTTRVSASRAIVTLRKRGLIDTNGHRIVLINENKLREMLRHSSNGKGNKPPTD
ncbi:Crp/Fnr family transcriptional regulator [Candidatus Magnetominusculus dajiuhuensis]|uniref:Crp/Fnr family transcriptional regulator n=1 Tax=Candidatus Magnetominusculus dajiuhuensis TaxID=3137712 RepID=UPI003B42A649